MGVRKMKILSQVSKIIMGQSPPGNTYNEFGEGLPFYQGVTDFGFKYPTRRIFCSVPKRIAEKEDILISVRAPIGPTNVAYEKCIIGRGLAAIRPNSKEESDFIMAFLKFKESYWYELESS